MTENVLNIVEEDVAQLQHDNLTIFVVVMISLNQLNHLISRGIPYTVSI